MLEKMWEKAKSGYASLKTTSVVPVCALSLSSDVIAVEDGIHWGRLSTAWTPAEVVLVVLNRNGW